ncbi:hypothetical protein Y032_0045g1094 [Ancylostoma ceylanicum]|uniref:Uncharacterized protein n=1 Tax=Ancylostoma ceylanicum TaxID=53326 RepID=A0A016UBT8_9BILA|nr:hypothetical protein Y032_0045g1094 [Ancylostoma ceylanicum]
MKRSADHLRSTSPRKIPRRDREAFEALDKDALIEKILSMTDELDETNKVINKAKRRESVWRQKAAEKHKEIKDLIKERNSAYFSGVTPGPAQRDQLIDPFFYESFISMKEKITAKDKTISEHQEAIKLLEKNKDSEVLSQFMKTKGMYVKKLRDNERNLRTIATMESNLALVHTTLRAMRQEKRDYTTEIAERDAKIADLYKELYNLRGALSVETASNHSGDGDMKDDTKQELEDLLNDEKPLVEEAEESNTVVTVENGDGVEVDVAVLHRASPYDEEEEELDRPAAVNDERSVSVGENGTLKITV